MESRKLNPSWHVADCRPPFASLLIGTISESSDVVQQPWLAINNDRKKLTIGFKQTHHDLVILRFLCQHKLTGAPLEKYPSRPLVLGHFEF